MIQPDLLQQWSQARCSLSSALAPRAVSILVGKHRSWSGFRWRDEFVVTAAEALGGRGSALIIGSHSEHKADVVACDLATDVAVFRVPAQASVSAAPIADLSLEAGAGIVFVGRSRRGALVSFGTVRLAGAAWSSRRGGAIDQRLEFEGNLDARFEGALVADFAGSAQAMLVSGPRGTLLGIPASTIDRVVTAVQRHGYLPRPYLGLRLQSLWLDDATRTRWGRSTRGVAVIAGIESGSPADAAGLAPGDLLDSIDGVVLDDIEAVATYLARTTPGQLLQLRLRRGGESSTVSVKVADRRAH